MTCLRCRSNAAYRTPTGWVCDVCGRYERADAADYHWHGLPLGHVEHMRQEQPGRVEYAPWGPAELLLQHPLFWFTPGRVEFSCWGPSPLLAIPHAYTFMS